IMRGTFAQRVVLHALTAVVYLSTLTTFWVMVAAVRPGAPYLTTLAVAQLPTVLATFMPTPGGAGILEIVPASLFLTGTARGRRGRCPRDRRAVAVPVRDRGRPAGRRHRRGGGGDGRRRVPRLAPIDVLHAVRDRPERRRHVRAARRGGGRRGRGGVTAERQ